MSRLPCCRAIPFYPPPLVSAKWCPRIAHIYKISVFPPRLNFFLERSIVDRVKYVRPFVQYSTTAIHHHQYQRALEYPKSQPFSDAFLPVHQPNTTFQVFPHLPHSIATMLSVRDFLLGIAVGFILGIICTALVMRYWPRVVMNILWACSSISMPRIVKKTKKKNTRNGQAEGGN